MRETGGKLSQRDHLFVLEKTRSKRSRAIEHEMNENSRQLVTFADHFRKVLTKDREQFGRFFGNHVRRRSHNAGIRHHSGDVSTTPLHHFPAARRTFDMYREMPAEHDVETDYGA